MQHLARNGAAAPRSRRRRPARAAVSRWRSAGGACWAPVVLVRAGAAAALGEAGEGEAGRGVALADRPGLLRLARARHA
jgi:hypothetical protein